MKKIAIAALCLVGSVAPVFAVEAPPSDVVIIDHAKMDAALAKGGSLLENSRYKVMGGHREGPGQVEIHTSDTDIFFITEGSATLITGGTAVDAKEIAAGELRADKSTGGITHHITKGDVVIIPAGVPHWMPEVTKPFVYFVVKVTK
jgi:mannose-6-phosphate isomerase-like protein (cupin superfamily)